MGRNRGGGWFSEFLKLPLLVSHLFSYLHQPSFKKKKICWRVPVLLVSNDISLSSSRHLTSLHPSSFVHLVVLSFGV